MLNTAQTRRSTRSLFEEVPVLVGTRDPYSDGRSRGRSARTLHNFVSGANRLAASNAGPVYIMLAADGVWRVNKRQGKSYRGRGPFEGWI